MKARPNANFEIMRQQVIAGYLASPERYDPSWVWAWYRRLYPHFHRAQAFIDHFDVEARFVSEAIHVVETMSPEVASFERLRVLCYPEASGGMNDEELMAVLQYLALHLPTKHGEVLAKIDLSAPREAGRLLGRLMPQHFDLPDGL